MAESRDRLSRSNAGATPFDNQQQSAHRISIFRDEAGAGFATPFRRGDTPMTGMTRRPSGRAATRGRAVGVGRENVPSGNLRRGQGRGGGSPLPPWHPRVPLRDITAIVRAIERRAARRLREPEEDLESETPTPPHRQTPDEPTLVAQLEQNLSLNHTTSKGTDECLTPQQPERPVNNIYSVELMEELRTVKNTPSVKKAERAGKMKILRSMR